MYVETNFIIIVKSSANVKKQFKKQNELKLNSRFYCEN